MNKNKSRRKNLGIKNVTKQLTYAPHSSSRNQEQLTHQILLKNDSNHLQYDALNMRQNLQCENRKVQHSHNTNNKQNQYNSLSFRFFYHHRLTIFFIYGVI